MLTNQRGKFNLPEEVTYLNTAYMSPLLTSVSEAGKNAITVKERPYEIVADDFFDPLTQLKQNYSQLIDCEEPERIAIVPSVSYGIANCINNIDINMGDEILVLDEQFPSNIYSWKRLVNEARATLKVVKKPTVEEHIGKAWNADVLNAITDRTKVVAMCHTHWADGTLFDLKAIREKTKKYGALLIIDGTQSVGALPFSVKEFQPDALICAGYKWLLGPYAVGLAYYGPYFDDGVPIEEGWSNRLNSEYFAGLTAYEDEYKPLANRYNVGEQANFIAVPMLTKSINQLLEWTPECIQAYCQNITEEPLKRLSDIGCSIEDAQYRGHHLFGIKLGKPINLDDLKEALAEQNIYVSIRGDYVRVSVHLFNRKSDIERLVDVLLKMHQ